MSKFMRLAVYPLFAKPRGIFRDIDRKGASEWERERIREIE